ncbi:cadherin-like domain-containing protein [Vibrio navarrensis]|uniref:Cadherin-like domain-containing protein n=1 Tax=Vibrio navarrensis TaxID=29495 RepID=A0AAJ4IDV2_9VIBR|nr:cadherin-like domain-containing protein [Vibrio navarrensis]
MDNGTVVIAADGAMTFEPAADFNGEINFGYQVKDADGDGQRERESDRECRERCGRRGE